MPSNQTERIARHGIELLWLADNASAVADDILDYRFVGVENKTALYEMKRLVTKRVGKEDDERGTSVLTSTVRSCVPRLDWLSARVCRVSPDVTLITGYTAVKYLTPYAQTTLVSTSGLTDLMVGGRSQSLFRIGSNIDSGKLSRVLSSLFTTEGSKIRSMKGFNIMKGEKSKLEDGMRHVEAASVDTEVTMEITVSHTRSITGGAKENTRENIIVRCSPGKENKYDMNTTVISTKSDNIKVNVQMDESREDEKEAETVIEADKGEKVADIEAASGVHAQSLSVRSPNTTGDSSTMDWSPGEPATPIGGSSSTASSAQGLGT